MSTLSDGWRHILMLLLLSPHLSLLLPGAICVALSAVLFVLSFVAPFGIMLGSLHWLPVFLGPMLLIIGVQALLLGSFAAYRSPLTPPELRSRLAFLASPGAVNTLLARFTLCALVGAALDVVLLALWIVARSGQSLLGIAGVAQALIVIGICGIFATFAAEYSREQLGW